MKDAYNNKYSMVSNNCVGWNKYVGGHIHPKLIIV